MRQVIWMLQQEPYSEEWKKRAADNRYLLLKNLYWEIDNNKHNDINIKRYLKKIDLLDNLDKWKNN